MCMSQVWYVGPISLLAGGAPYGVDLGWAVVTSWKKRSLILGCCDGDGDLSAFKVFRAKVCWEIVYVNEQLETILHNAIREPAAVQRVFGKSVSISWPGEICAE